MSGVIYVRVSQLTKMIPVSKASIWRKVKDGSFPKPVKLGDRITAWHMADIEAWLASRHEEAAK
jgi:prophage regulatory protein